MHISCQKRSPGKADGKKKMLGKERRSKEKKLRERDSFVAEAGFEIK
jgi:hypothetical protein